MTKYWMKIGLGAGLIFLVGFAVISAGRHVRGSIISSKDLTIPLGGFIPFRIDGIEGGTLTSLVIHRDSPKSITGFDVNARLSDSTMFEKLQECRLSVTDVSHFDEHATFTCLASDSGYQSFGEVRLTLRVPGGSHVLAKPLLLPEAAVQDLQRRSTDPSETPVAESLAVSLREVARVQDRVRNDSITAARLEKRAHDMQRRADSIRAGNPGIPPPVTPKP